MVLSLLLYMKYLCDKLRFHVYCDLKNCNASLKTQNKKHEEKTHILSSSGKNEVNYFEHASLFLLVKYIIRI